jgi:hypothetical protein
VGTLERAIDRRDRRVKQPAGFRGRPSQDVAEEQDGTLPWREMLDRGDERELHGLAHLIPRIRARRGIRDALEGGIRVGLKPWDFCRRLALWHPVRWGTKSFGKHSSRVRPAGEEIQARVGGDPIEPSPERARSPESERADPTPSTEECLLDKVLGVVETAEHAIAVELQLPPVRLGQTIERLPIAPLGRLQERGLVRPVAASAHEQNPSLLLGVIGSGPRRLV